MTVKSCNETNQIKQEGKLGRDHLKCGDTLLAQGQQDPAMRSYYQENQIKFDKLRAEGKIGAILICGLPKSGNDYLWHSLMEGLNINFFHLSKGGFPNDTLYYNLIRKHCEQDCVIPNHVHANPTNLFVIGNYLDRLVVNIRDLRQATLSWCHYMHLLKSLKESGLIPGVPFIKKKLIKYDYFAMSFTEQIDFQINEYYLPISIKWIETWLNAEENQSFYPKILFTQQQDLKQNPKVFFESILDFYEIDKSRFTFPKPPEFKPGTHNRKGSVDEWREVFTPEQAERVSRMIPKRIMERFSWS